MRRDLRWVAIGGALSGIAYLLYGLDGALTYLTSYLLALAISIDNVLMVALVVNEKHSVSRASLTRWSFLCAIAVRISLPIAVLLLIRLVPGARYAVGACLVF